MMEMKYAGHVRVYEWDALQPAGNGDYVQGSDIDGEAAGDEFNFISLSSDGTIVAIGANAGTVMLHRGHVRVYEYSSNLGH